MNKILALLLLSPALLAASAEGFKLADSDLPLKVQSTDENDTITLSGKVYERLYPLPIDETDHEICYRLLVLRLNRPIAIELSGGDSTTESELEVEFDDFKQLPLEQEIEVSGTIRHATTAHHSTTYVMDVTNWQLRS